MQENLEKPGGEKEGEVSLERSMFDNLRSRKQGLLGKSQEEWGINNKAIMEFVRKLKGTDMDLKSYASYCALTAPEDSDFDEDSCKHPDFPDPYSVEEFLGRLENEQFEREKKWEEEALESQK